MNDKTVLLLASGPDIPQRSLDASGKTVICVNGGSQLAATWGIQPDLIIGDLDSMPKGSRFQDVPILHHPVEKDKTDLELAVEYCLEQDYRQICIVGLWGGRIDHSIGGLEVLYTIGRQGIDCTVMTKNHEMILVNHSLTKEIPIGTTVSLFALSERVDGISTQGLYYPLAEETLLRGTTRGVSNHSTEATVTITVQAGVLLAVIANEGKKQFPSGRS